VVFAEAAGLATPAPLWGTLAPFSMVEIRVYDVRKKKRTMKEKLVGFGSNATDADAAVDSASTYLSGYPQAVRALSILAYGRLRFGNVMHDLAKGTAYESEFPSMEKVLKENAKRFTVKRPKIKNWKMPRTKNAYVFLAFPKKDKELLVIWTDVDLLLKEFGQEFDSLDPYIAQRLTRIADVGFGVDSPAEVPLLQFEREWSSYMVSRPKGGSQKGAAQFSCTGSSRS